MYFTCIDILLFLKVRGISCFLHSMCYLYLYGIFLKHFRSFGSFGPFEGKCLAHRDPLGFGTQAPRAHGGVEPVRDLRLRGRCGSLLLQGEDHGGLLWTGWTGWVTAGQKMGIFLGSDISLVIWFEFHCHTELQLLFDFVLRRNGWRWNWIQRTLNQSSAEPNQTHMYHYDQLWSFCTNIIQNHIISICLQISQHVLPQLVVDRRSPTRIKPPPLSQRPLSSPLLTRHGEICFTGNFEGLKLYCRGVHGYMWKFRMLFSFSVYVRSSSFDFFVPTEHHWAFTFSGARWRSCCGLPSSFQVMWSGNLQFTLDGDAAKTQITTAVQMALVTGASKHHQMHTIITNYNQVLVTSCNIYI